MQDITNIAVRHQQWEGWPEAVDNSMVLALTGIPLEHTLVLRSTGGSDTTTENHITQGESSNTRRNSNRGGNGEPIEIDSDSSVDEFEDASDFNGDDEIFAAPSSNRRVRHLSKCNHISTDAYIE